MINNIGETFDRSLNEVLKRYYRSGGVKTISQTTIDFVPCDINFDIRSLDQPSTKPLIVFAGTRVTDQDEYHVKDPNNNYSHAFEVKAKIERTVYVKTKLREGDPTASVQYAKRIYDSLFALFSIQWIEFSTVGIIRPRIQLYPEQVEATDFNLLAGIFSCEVACAFTKQPTA